MKEALNTYENGVLGAPYSYKFLGQGGGWGWGGGGGWSLFYGDPFLYDTGSLGF